MKMGDGVLELYTPRMQGYASVGVAAAGTVFQVAFYGAPHCRELAAYLVMTACKQFYSKQEITVGTAHEPVSQTCFLGVFHLMVIAVRLVLFLVAHLSILLVRRLLYGDNSAQWPDRFCVLPLS